MKFQKTKWMGYVVLFAALSCGNALADEGQSTTMIKTLQDQMKKMQETIKQQGTELQTLKNRPAQIKIAAQGETPGATIAPVMTDDSFKDKLDNYMGGKNASDWLKNLSFKGDLRLRYETASFAQGNPANTGHQNRFRFRLRYGFEKKFDHDMKVGFRLASGGTTDGTSTNQTLTGNFADKVHTIDQAYAIYTPTWAQKGPIKKLEIGGGKFSNPFTRGATELVWDSDVNPEGAYETIDINLLDTENVGLKSYFTAGQMILREAAHSPGSSDSELYAFQLGLLPELKLADMPIKSTHALSFYNYSDYAHNSVFTVTGGNPNVDGDATALDANEFKVIEIYNDVTLKPFSFLPTIKPYFDFAINTAEAAPAASAGGENKALALGVKIGKPKVKGDWGMSYAYKYIEANSVVGAFNDSDFGHSGRKGNVLGLEYKLTDGLTLGATGFLINNLNHDTIARDQLERRFFVDLVWAI